MKRLPRWTGIDHWHHWRGACKREAFTMVETLVSSAVLMLLIAITAGMINGATATIATNRNRIDADATARMVFDRMAADFETMVKRRDVDYVCKGMTASMAMTGNDSFYFYGEAPAYFSGTTNNSPVALVGYRVVSGTAPSLERLSKGLLRDGGGSAPGSMVFLSYAAAAPSTPLTQTTLQGNWADLLSGTSTDSACHQLAGQVFRMEVCYLLKPYTKPDGTGVASKYSVVPYNKSDASHGAVNGFQDVSAIVVAIAILDDASLRKLADPEAALSAMAGKLADAAESDFSGTQPNLMAQKWSAAIKSADFAASGVPKSVASQVRVYERHFYLNNLLH